MSGKTPGQAAYEAAEAHSPYDAPPWDDVNDKLRAAWEAAAQAATVTAWRLLDEARAERDELRDKLADETYDNAPAELLAARSQVDHFRELVAEILAAHHTVVSAEQVAIWRERAGLPAVITGAGTEHLVDRA